MSSQHSEIPDLFISTIRSINSQTPKDWSIEQRTWHPKTIQEELHRFLTELMIESGFQEKWGGVDKINIPKNMSRQASTYIGFLRFKNRKAHPMIADQLNGIVFNDGRLTVELNKYPPRDIHLKINSEVALKYNPQLKKRVASGNQTASNENYHGQIQSYSHESRESSDEEFDMVSVMFSRSYIN